MNNKLFLVNVAYNGNRPRVSISISWRRFFNGVWQNVKDYISSVRNFMNNAVERRNVYLLNTYSILSWIVIAILLIEAMGYVQDTGGNLRQIWNIWAGFLSGYGIVTMTHHVGLLLLILALFRVICAPIAKWEQYYLKTLSDKSLTKEIRWQLLVQRADATVAKINGIITLTCGGIVAVAGATAIVWMIWTMLQG